MFDLIPVVAMVDLDRSCSIELRTGETKGKLACVDDRRHNGESPNAAVAPAVDWGLRLVV
ncbi:MAG: hypothetical protein M3458_15580 [Acidobacteriota bacterium]|nr:hypothetical protein [Acidobacteriota bacterium]